MHVSDGTILSEECRGGLCMTEQKFRMAIGFWVLGVLWFFDCCDRQRHEAPSHSLEELYKRLSVFFLLLSSHVCFMWTSPQSHSLNYEFLYIFLWSCQSSSVVLEVRTVRFLKTKTKTEYPKLIWILSHGFCFIKLWFSKSYLFGSVKYFYFQKGAYLSDTSFNVL